MNWFTNLFTLKEDTMADFSGFPEVDPETERVIDPSRYTPEQVRNAQQLASDMVGPAMMSDEQMRQCALYEAQHLNWLGKWMRNQGQGGSRIQKMIDATPQHQYEKLKRLAGK